METIVTQVLRPTEIIYLFIAVMNVFNAYNDREYTVHDNRHRLEALLHAYLRLKDAMEHLQQSLYTFDRESQSLIQMHARTVTKNEETLQSLREAVLDAKFMNRVKRTEKVLKECEADSEKIMGFLSTQVVPVLREREQESQYDYVYEADNNVPPNPPRLTLDYSTVLTCEGQLKAAVLKEDGSRVVGVVALGMGGVGKTCALRGLAEEEDIKQRFPGGLYFIQVGKDATLSTVIHGVATAVERTGNPSLGERLKGETTLQELANRASIWFRHQTCLFLIDDIWLGQSINSSVLRVLVTMLSERSRLVYTTRSQQSVNVCSNVIEFSAKETYSQMARRMLMTHAEFDCKETLNERNEEAVRGILRICDGLPVAIGVVGETVRKENRRRLDDNADIWNVVYDRLRFRKESISDGFAEAYGSVRLVVDTSLDVLQSAHSDTDFDDMFSALCVLEKHQMVPIHMLRNLWGLPDLEKTKDIVEELDEVSLVRKLFDGQLVLLQLHDVILDIAIRKASEQYEVKRFWEVLIENYITQERSSREDTGGGQSSEDQVETSHEREKVECMRWHQKLCCFNVIGTVDTETDQQNDGPQLQTDGENKFWEWWNTEDDRYIHDNICRALRGAGYDKHLLWLVSKPQWIVSRLQKSGFYAVEQDLDAAKGVALCMNQIDKSLCKHLDMVRKAARMSCPHVANNRREAWFQIHGRLLWYATQCERTKQFVEEIDRCAPRPWAKASMGFLEQAGTAAAEKIECSGEPLTLRYDKSRVSFFFRKYNGRFVREQYSFISGETESHAYDLPEFGGKELRPIDSALCQDLNTVVMLVEGEQIVRWNLESMETSHWLANGIRCTALNPEENLVVCGLQDGRLQVRELEGGEHVGRPFVGHTDTVICVAWSGDGKRVASVSQDKTVLYGCGK